MLVITGIVAFNLIIPYGKVIFSFGPLKITSGALTAGIHRAVTFEALIMLSKVSIRHDLRLPGAFGELLGESLRIFSAMMTRKRSVTGKRKNLISKIDAILMGVENAELPETENQERKTMPAGYVILAFVVILCWLPLFI
jgi:heptaprenyl diphosphate synthase